MEQQNNYRSYEYMTKTAGSREAGEIINRYESLGWELDRHADGLLLTTLTFKRDRNINNKSQLNRLQLRIEDAGNEIVYLEESKTKGATIFSLAAGIFGALTFGGGMSLIMFNADPVSWGAVIGGTVLGVVGGAIAAVVYPIYKRLIRKKTAKINPRIEEKRDEIADLCQEAYLMNSAQ